MNQRELACWLALYRYEGIGPQRFSALLSQEKSLSNCFDREKLRPAFIQWCEAQKIKISEPNWRGVEKDLAWAAEPDCHILTWQDPYYPPQLKEIPAAPPILFVKGNVSALSTFQIAIVGSRHPTSQGKEHAYRFAYELASREVSVTSGLALGVDGESHRGALAAKGITIAVLGNSLDHIYPPRHEGLASEILSQQGVLISEFPLNTPPKAMHFPRRNRLISGLSKGVLVVEAALKSGSLITAHYALEQGREIFALPGTIQNPLTKGTHWLIREGAKCTESVEHILEEFEERAEKESPPLIRQILSPTKSFHPVLSFIEAFCTPVDEIIVKTGLTAEKLSSILLELELQGEITAVPGGYIKLN
jgi:DNA processing protein